MTLLHENWHLEWIGLKEREITTDDQKSNPHCSLFSCVNNRHYERVAPAICTWISVKVSMNQVSIEKIQLWEATLGHWMATSGGNSCKGIALTFTSILVQTQHTSRYVTHSSPAFFIVSKIIFFSQATWFWKKTHCFSSFACIQLLFCQLQCTPYSLKTKVDLKEICRMFFCACVVSKVMLILFIAFKYLFSNFDWFKSYLNFFGPEFS